MAIPDIDRDDLDAYRELLSTSIGQAGMTNYLIRSMTTVDQLTAGRGPQEELSQPLHIYLLKPEGRCGALWSVYGGNLQLFESIDDALAHGAAVLGEERFDVVPVMDLELPTYWDAREGNPRARVIGTEIVREQ